ncbi:hypothetical protein [Spongiimicrobium sp. 3-5]|uniref:hypothetical protein n=1 Tax=Spongiimicrobium sp. 3-5 TaxID=3332596 RepID=UPI00397ECCE2
MSKINWFGILLTLSGIIYLVTLFLRRSPNEGNLWDKSMLFRGIVGGLALIAIGLVMVFSE